MVGWLRRLCVGWVGVVIIKLKANLSSTELGLTSQLELSLAKIKIKRGKTKIKKNINEN